MVYRIYVEKKKELAAEANALMSDFTSLLGIKGTADLIIEFARKRGMLDE